MGLMTLFCCSPDQKSGANLPYSEINLPLYLVLVWMVLIQAVTTAFRTDREALDLQCLSNWHFPPAPWKTLPDQLEILPIFLIERTINSAPGLASVLQWWMPWCLHSCSQSPTVQKKHHPVISAFLVPWQEVKQLHTLTYGQLQSCWQSAPSPTQMPFWVGALVSCFHLNGFLLLLWQGHAGQDSLRSLMPHRHTILVIESVAMENGSSSGSGERAKTFLRTYPWVCPSASHYCQQLALLSSACGAYSTERWYLFSWNAAAAWLNLYFPHWHGETNWVDNNSSNSYNRNMTNNKKSLWPCLHLAWTGILDVNDHQDA